MIKKEIKRIIEIQKYIENITHCEIESNLLKQDFYRYDLANKKNQPLFDKKQQPQDRIFSLIQDHDVGSYYQLQLDKYDWNYNLLSQLKNKYLCERRQIVESGITLKQVLTFNSKFKENHQKDPYMNFIKSYEDQKQHKNQFLWEFLDQIFNIFQKHPVIENRKATKKLSEQKINQQTYQKINNMMDIFRKLSSLVQSNYASELQNQQQKKM